MPWLSHHCLDDVKPLVSVVSFPVKLGSKIYGDFGKKVVRGQPLITGGERKPKIDKKIR